MIHTNIFNTLRNGSALYLYGLEHELSVVIGSQVFGDVKTNWADRSEEMEHHWNHLGGKRWFQLWRSHLCIWSYVCSCDCSTHLHLSSLPRSGRFSSFSCSIFHTVLTTVDQNLHDIQRLWVCSRLNGKCVLVIATGPWICLQVPLPYLNISLLAKVYNHSPAKVSILIFYLKDENTDLLNDVKIFHYYCWSKCAAVPWQVVQAVRMASSIWVCGWTPGFLYSVWPAAVWF